MRGKREPRKILSVGLTNKVESMESNESLILLLPEFKWRMETICKFSLNPKLKFTTKKDQFTKFKDLSLDCNHVEGFQNSEILETLYGFR